MESVSLSRRAFEQFISRALSGKQTGVSSGKQSAFMRYANTFVLSGTVAVGSVTLERVKKHSNMVVDVTVSYFNVSELTNPVFSLTVNGHPVPPLSWMFTCPADVLCLNSMTWWVDLDDLEQQNPGEIIAHPLSIQLQLSPEIPIPTTASGVIIQMGARFQAK